MADQIYTITNFSTNTTATIRYFTIATTLTQQQHSLNLTGWLPPFDTYTAFTGASTVRTETKTYLSGVFDEQAITTATTSATSTTLYVDDNSGIGTGWDITGTGVAPGATVVSTPGSNRVIMSTTPSSPIPPSTQITFIPPEYTIDVNNTTNLAVGWIAASNGYQESQGVSILEIRSGGELLMSGQPTSTPSVGNITFISNSDTLLTIEPLSSATFSMNYTRVTSSLGTYTSAVNIGAELDTSVVLPIKNFMLVSSAPVSDPASPFWESGGGGNAGAPCGTVGSVSCSAECFSPETLITMADGSKKPIIDITEGDLVQGLSGINCVTKLLSFVVGTNKLHGFNGKDPFITSCHPIRTDQGWGAFDPDYLEKNWNEDWKILCEENNGPVVKIDDAANIGFWKNNSMVFEQIAGHTFIELPEDYKVYNLVLDNDHTFIANDVVVHNKECFTGDTLIDMIDQAPKQIDQIVIGDLVLDALTGNANKVIGIKVTEYQPGRRLFSTTNGVKPFITEQHAFYNESNELCAMSEECEYLAPWLGPIKIVDVPEIKTAQEPITVYNLMFETGNSHYANGVPVNNMVGHGGLYVLLQKGYISESEYAGYIYHLENTFGPNKLKTEHKAKIFKIVFRLTKYILNNNNLRSRILSNILAWAVKNRETLYPYIETWFTSRIRNWIFKK